MNLSSLYLAISSERRLNILAALRQCRCATLEELSRQLGIDIATLLYEVNILRHGGLVTACEGSVCLTDRGQNVISKIVSLDQDLLSHCRSKNSILNRILNILTLRTLAVYIAVSGNLSVVPLLILSILGLALFYRFKIDIILLVPLEFHTFDIALLGVTPLALFVYYVVVLWFFSKKLLVTEACEATLFTICVVSMNAIVYYVLMVIIGITTATLMLLEAMKLIIATIGTIATSTLISYHTGKTFESTFLTLSLTLLIPCLLAYALLR